MRRQSKRLGWHVLAASLLSMAAALAQQAPTAPVSETVRVHVVNVEVNVTGKDGKPVLDLKPEDFELFEDGRLVHLTNFLGPAPPSGSAASNAAEALPVPPPAPEIARVSQEDQQRTLVVFIDDLNLTRLTRRLALDNLGRFLDEQLRNGYREVVMAFDLSLTRLTPLTSDPSVVSAALDVLRGRVNEGTAFRTRRDSFLADLGRGGAVEPGPRGDIVRRGLLDDAAAFGPDYGYHQVDLLHSLLGVIDSLSGLPGRKALLFVSEGIPTEPGAEVFAEAAARFGGGGGGISDVEAHEMRYLFWEVAHHANAGRVTLYTFSVPAPGGNVTAEARDPSLANVRSLDAFNRDWSLSQFVTTTGGQKLYNPEMLQRMAVDLETYYSLGYSPSHYGDGKYHRLLVKVARAGVTVRAREGYLDKGIEQRQEDVTTAALLAGGNSNPLEARVELGKPERQGRKRVSVPLTLFIPAANLVLIPVGDEHEGKVSVAIALGRRDGRTSEVHRETFPIKVPTKHVVGFLKHSTSFVFTLVVEPGDATVSVTARDEMAQVESVIVSDVTLLATAR